MAQKEEIKWANETTSVIPDISMLPRKGEYMQWWPIPSLRSTQVRLHSKAQVMMVLRRIFFSFYGKVKGRNTPFHSVKGG